MTGAERPALDIDLGPTQQSRGLDLPVRALSSSVLDAAPIGMALTGPDGVVYWANASLGRLVGRDVADVVGSPFGDLTGRRVPVSGSGTRPDDSLPLTPAAEDLVAPEVPAASMQSRIKAQDSTEERWVLPDGRVIWVIVSSSTALDAAGDPVIVRGEPCTILQVQEITEQRLIKAELQRSNAELTQFAYVASHDLSEPLRVIAGHVELLSRRYSGQLDERADEWIKYAVDGCTRMRSLIDDLLQYSRLGRIDPEHRLVRLADVVQSSLAEFEDATAVRVGELPAVSGSPGELQRLFGNLIGNALRFVSPGTEPQVSIESRQEGDEWVVNVDDNGIGVAPEYRERVFGLFQRLHRQDEYPGTGIGLAVCRKVMELHFGRIWIEDSPLGGTRFSLTFPAVPTTV